MIGARSAPCCEKKTQDYNACHFDAKREIKPKIFEFLCRSAFMRDIFAAEAAPTRNKHICEKIVRFNSARISIITGFLPAVDMTKRFA